MKYWLPVVLWMALIYWGSTDALSSERTGRFIAPLLRWLKPGISDSAIQDVQWVARKGGHLTEYAVLAMLLQRALRQPRGFVSNPTALSALAVNAGTLAVATLYAISDELHQSLVRSRLGSVWDVLIDMGGAGLGLLLLAWFAQRRSVTEPASARPESLPPG